jgi:DNA-binding beta-propeller fold protein YncE
MSIAALALLAGGVVSSVFGMSNKLGPEYSYDIEHYSKIAPALMLYRQVGPALETGLKDSRAIAVHTDGTICAVGDDKVVIFRPDERKEIQLPQEPTGMAFDHDGTMIAALTNHLVFLNADGTIRQTWKSPSDKALLTSIAADAENVYAADAVGKVVWRFSRTGKIINAIGRKDTARNIPGIVVPSPYFDIAMVSDGLLRVVNPGRHWIEAYTPAGDREWYWGKASVGIEGFSGCCNPVSLAVLPDGGFVTCEKGLIRVKVYNAEGEFVGVVAGPDELGRTEIMRVCDTPEQCGQQRFDAAVDAAGRIYILDTLNHTIRIFEKK